MLARTLQRRVRLRRLRPHRLKNNVHVVPARRQESRLSDGLDRDRPTHCLHRIETLDLYASL